VSFAILALRLLTLHGITQGKISTDGDKGEDKLMSAIEDLQQVCNEMVRYFHLSDVCSHHFVRVRSPYGVTQASKCSTIFPELLCPDKPLPTRGLLHSQYLATFPNPSVEPRTRRVPSVGLPNSSDSTRWIRATSLTKRAPFLAQPSELTVHGPWHALETSRLPGLVEMSGSQGDVD